MKEFVKMTLAVMCGLFLMGIVGFFLLISALGSLIAAAGSSSSTVVLPREGVLAMDMSKYSFVEVANPNTDFQALLQGEDLITPVSIWSAVQAVRKAAQGPGVKFLYLKPDGMSIGLAQLQELRAALEEFRASGKAVIAYTETPTTAPQADGETTTRRPIIIETPTTTEEPTKEPVAPSTAREVDPGEPGWSPNV